MELELFRQDLIQTGTAATGSLVVSVGSAWGCARRLALRFSQCGQFGASV